MKLCTQILIFNSEKYIKAAIAQSGAALGAFTVNPVQNSIAANSLWQKICENLSKDEINKDFDGSLEQTLGNDKKNH